MEDWIQTSPLGHLVPDKNEKGEWFTIFARATGRGGTTRLLKAGGAILMVMVLIGVGALLFASLESAAEEASINEYLLRGICIRNKSHNLHLIVCLNCVCIYIFPGVGTRTF